MFVELIIQNNIQQLPQTSTPHFNLADTSDFESSQVSQSKRKESAISYFLNNDKKCLTNKQKQIQNS